MAIGYSKAIWRLEVAFIISVDTGEVLDFEVKYKHYFECRVHSKWDGNSDKYKSW